MLERNFWSWWQMLNCKIAKMQDFNEPLFVQCIFQLHSILNGFFLSTIYIVPIWNKLAKLRRCIFRWIHFAKIQFGKLKSESWWSHLSENIWHLIVYQLYETVQRHRQSGNYFLSMTFSVNDTLDRFYRWLCIKKNFLSEVVR